MPKPVLVQVDLNNLPGDDLATFYRLILRALCEAQPQLTAVEPALAAAAETLYRRVEDKTDPFLPQSALREALLLFREKGTRLVLVLDPFDRFCRTAALPIFDNLRGLRDSFKTTLSYLVGVRHELAALRDPLDLGGLYEILDAHLYWLGAIAEEDARWVIHQVAESTGWSFREEDIHRLLDLTGRYPALLRAAAGWLAEVAPLAGPEAWARAMSAQRPIQNRLEEIWSGLTREEQLALLEVQKLHNEVPQGEAQALDKTHAALFQQHGDILDSLVIKGLCQPAGKGWRISSGLLAAYVGGLAGRSCDAIWLDEETEELYQGQSRLDGLAPLEAAVLHFLVKHPRIRHTKTDLIVAAWPDELRQEGVTDDSLYQVIKGLRKRIEPNPSKPCYIITWRGLRTQEGGYEFLPDGRPG